MDRARQPFALILLASLLATSCSKQAVPAAQADPAEVHIPFTLTEQNNIVVSAVLNGTDTMQLMLHTAATDVTLTEDAVRRLKSITLTDTNQVQSWGGTSDARFSRLNQVRIGDLLRQNVTIRENKNSGKDTDGKFGLDFLQGHVVEIDFDHGRIALHETLPSKTEKYERLKLENRDGELLVQGSCLIEGVTHTHKFLLHTGYSGGLLLDDAFAASTGVDGKIKITDESKLTDSFGHVITVKKGILPVFVLGSTKITNVPVGFFAGSIGAQKMSVLGSEILKRFNVIFDVANGDLYLAPRQT